MQGKHSENGAILNHITNNFPNYFFGQMALARKSIQAGDLEKARSILNHWMETKKKFHVTEFNMFCKTQIDLHIREDKFEGALSWMKMWEGIEPDDPDFVSYQEHLGPWEPFSKFKNKQRKGRKLTKKE